jgi:aminoglycoside phosphotransferase (APT) family kinase protein
MTNLNYAPEDVIEVAKRFRVHGTQINAQRTGRGHINDTFIVETAETRYVVQRIEQKVFKRPIEVMHNIKLVLDALHTSLKKAGGDPLKESLTLVDAEDGLHYTVTEKGDCWRCYRYLDARSYDYVVNDEHGRHIAYEAARIFGEFQKHLADLPAEDFHETIPNFHYTPWRYQQLEQAIKNDVMGRVKECREDIAFAVERKKVTYTVVDLMDSEDIPRVIVHNDTKINNVMFDDTVSPEKAMAIIDLDTLMPGSRLYDFGDLVRTTTCPAAEDEPDLSKVVMDMQLFEQLVRGFYDSVGDLLNEAEIKHLAFAGKLITYGQGLRFLSDHIAGDKYYVAHREGHNLDRARTQLKMIQEMERQASVMDEIVNNIFRLRATS